jgi:hypothetical protein
VNGHEQLTPAQRYDLVKVRPMTDHVDRFRGGRHVNPTLQPYLPAEDSRTGIRWFLRESFYALLFAFIHLVFSVYIHLRIAYHAVLYRFYSVFHYHHRTPALIKRDVRHFKKLPTHVSVILTVDGSIRRQDRKDKLLNEASDIGAWCVSAGIPQLSIYEKTGA